MTAADESNVRTVERAQEQLEARLVQIVWPGGLGTGRTLQGQYRRERLSSLAEFVRSEVAAAVSVAKSEMVQCVAERDQARDCSDRLGERVAYYRDSEVPALRSNADGWARRAEAAEAAFARVKALADEMAASPFGEVRTWVTPLRRAALAGEQPDLGAPTDAGPWGEAAEFTPTVPLSTTDTARPRRSRPGSEEQCAQP